MTAPHHGHQWPRGHVGEERWVEGLLPQLLVVLVQETLVCLVAVRSDSGDTWPVPPTGTASWHRPSQLQGVGSRVPRGDR